MQEKREDQLPLEVRDEASAKDEDRDYLIDCSHHRSHHVRSLQHFDRTEDRKHRTRTAVRQEAGVDISNLCGLLGEVDHETF
eukprot:746876-Hanusia_phi.AAC.4